MLCFCFIVVQLVGGIHPEGKVQVVTVDSAERFVYGTTISESLNTEMVRCDIEVTCNPRLGRVCNLEREAEKQNHRNNKTIKPTRRE